MLGYTANDFQITEARWNKTVELINGINKDGAFVCYPGTEWCGNSAAGGDHNIVFLHDGKPEFPFDRHGNVARSFEWSEDMKGGELTPGAWPLDEVYATYAHDPEGHLLIPHVGGRRCNLGWHHPVLERLVEIGSSWGHFPWLLEDVVKHGYKLGAAANGDEHRGRCGGGVPGTAVFGTKGGLTGVIADKLDRRTVGRALRARHSWATTGEHLVALSSCGSAMQGDELEHRGPATIAYRFLGDAGWDEIAAYDHTGCFWRRNLQEEAGYSDRLIRFRWGGARIRDRYRWAAWKGTITISNGVIHNTRARGFEHQEETTWRVGATQIGFRSDTYGDADAIEIELSNLASCRIRVEGTIDGYVKVGDPLKGNPFVHCPSFVWEASGAELLAAKRLNTSARRRRSVPGAGADERDAGAARCRRHHRAAARERPARLPPGLFPRPPDRRRQGLHLAALRHLPLSFEPREDAARVALEDLVLVRGAETAARRCSAWCRRSSGPVSGSMPRTAPTISEANRMLSAGMTLSSRSMPGW